MVPRRATVLVGEGDHVLHVLQQAGAAADAADLRDRAGQSLRTHQHSCHDDHTVSHVDLTCYV